MFVGCINHQLREFRHGISISRRLVWFAVRVRITYLYQRYAGWLVSIRKLRSRRAAHMFVQRTNNSAGRISCCVPKCDGRRREHLLVTVACVQQRHALRVVSVRIVLGTRNNGSAALSLRIQRRDRCVRRVDSGVSVRKRAVWQRVRLATSHMHQRPTLRNIHVFVVPDFGSRFVHIQRVDGRKRRGDHRLPGIVCRVRIILHIANTKLQQRYALRNVSIFELCGRSTDKLYTQRTNDHERRISGSVSKYRRERGRHLCTAGTYVQQRRSLRK